VRPVVVGRLRSARRARALVVGGATAAIVVAANASQGAYFSQSWGWVALAFLVPTTVLLILDRVTVPGRLRIAFLASMGALAVWIALVDQPRRVAAGGRADARLPVCGARSRLRRATR
jgi:hypothetical protein